MIFETTDIIKGRFDLSVPAFDAFSEMNDYLEKNAGIKFELQKKDVKIIEISKR